MTSICQQLSYTFMLPFEDIPDDLVPLTAYMKELLNYATEKQPLLICLDSVDQLVSTVIPPNSLVSWFAENFFWLSLLIQEVKILICDFFRLYFNHILIITKNADCSKSLIDQLATWNVDSYSLWTHSSQSDQVKFPVEFPAKNKLHSRRIWSLVYNYPILL